MTEQQRQEYTTLQQRAHAEYLRAVQEQQDYELWLTQMEYAQSLSETQCGDLGDMDPCTTYEWVTGGGENFIRYWKKVPVGMTDLTDPPPIADDMASFVSMLETLCEYRNV